MDSNQKSRQLLNYSTFDLAVKHLRNCSVMSASAMLVPLPLTAGAVYGFFHFQPTWYKDPFLWAILILFTVGQLGALVQLLVLFGGTRKAKKAMAIVRKAGDTPDLEALQERMVTQGPSCHIRDSVLRWVQLGVQGQTKGIERMMEHASARRDQTATKIIGFHTLINRTTLKFGFLGTLIGLMMTFEPMKNAMLSLKDSDGEFRFINDLVRAIDGDAYAIVTTLFATGLSVFIELLTIQIFERILGQFDLVNNNLDDWCLIHLQPWIDDNYGAKKSYDGLVELQRQFSEKVIALQTAIDEQLRTLTTRVQETGRQMMNLMPLEQELGKKIAMLADYEKQYRQFISAKMQSFAPAVAGVEKSHE